MGCSSALAEALGYQTQKQVEIKDPRLVCVHKTVLITILLYIGVYVLGIQQEYLEWQHTQGLVATKVKGRTDATGIHLPSPLSLDEADVVHPAMEPGGVFLVTRMVETKAQRQGICLPETKDQKSCTTDADCMDTSFPVLPGNCTPVAAGGSLCAYRQWCPAEDEDGALNPNSPTTIATFQATSRFTIWFKGSIHFTQFGNGLDTFFSTVTERNPIPVSVDPDHANLFSVQELLDRLPLETSFADIQARGCLMKVILQWNCDLNKDYGDACVHGIEVQRLDNPIINDGFNYRTRNYYLDLNTNETVRDEVKYYGVRIFVWSNGKARKISLVQIILTISSGIALFSVATVVADLVLFHFLKESPNYRAFKVEEVRRDDNLLLGMDDTYSTLDCRSDKAQAQKEAAAAEVFAGLASNGGNGGQNGHRV